jgi:AcrR family transcriptional regulator
MAGEGVAVWRERTLELRRARIVAAMVEVVCEQGFSGASLARVCARAKLSRQAFYDTFDSRESCFLAVLDEGRDRVGRVVSEAFEGADCWLDGVRTALAGLLMFFDAEPGLARVCVVESLATAPWALERRERHVSSLTRLIVEHWGALGPEEPYPFANAGVIVSVLGTIQGHLSTKDPKPLVALLGPLMGQVASPYMDASAVAEEVERSRKIARELPAMPGSCRRVPAEDVVELPDLLLDSRAHRARESVLYVAEHPGSSNRQIARAVGINHDTQISTMLARLSAAGLLRKDKAKPGGPNAWVLTRHGLSIARRLTDG